MSTSSSSRELVRVLLVSFASIVLLLVGVDAVAPPPPTGPVEPAAMPGPAAEPVEGGAAGAAWCAVADDGAGEAQLRLTAVGSDPAEVEIVEHRDGEAEVVDELTVYGDHWRSASVDARARVEVRWWDTPVAVTWEPADEPATTALPCATEPAGEWHVPGLSTATTSESRVHLYNPFEVDAVAAVVFATDHGPERLVRTDGIAVPARSGTVVDLNELLPGESLLAATVEVHSGRLVAAGERVEAPIEVPTEIEDVQEEPEAPRGRTLLAATSEASTTARLPYAAVTDEWRAWLEVHNPGEREAVVAVRVSNPSAAGALEDTVVPAGEVRRIDLTDRSADDAFGVEVESVNDEPVTVAGYTALPAGEERAFGGHVLESSRSRSWVVGAPLDGPRDGHLVVYNPGTSSTTVTVDAGSFTPESWEDVSIGPNHRHMFRWDELPEPVPVRVESDEPVVAGHRSVLVEAGDDRGLLLGLAAPLRTWDPPTLGLAVRHDPTLLPMPGVVVGEVDADEVDDTAGEAGGEAEDADEAGEPGE